jgi:hypothetical protein
MKNPTCIMRLPLLSGALAVATICNSASATLIVDYDFNDNASGIHANSTGSVTTPLTLYSSSSTQANIRGADGSGVSGQAGDYALDIGSTTDAMGSQATTGGQARTLVNATDFAASIGSLSSFTVTGWFKSSSQLNFSTQLFALGSSAIVVRSGNTAGNLSLTVNNVAVGETTGANVFGTTNEWVFFAVTYDGTSTTDNLIFYGGTVGGSVSVIATLSSTNGGMTQPSSASLFVSPSIRPYDGYMDNIRLYGSASDATGALSASAVQGVYASAIPEPSASSMALVIGGLALSLILVRRKRLSPAA